MNFYCLECNKKLSNRDITKYLSKIEKKYGITAVNNIKQMPTITLERDILA